MIIGAPAERPHNEIVTPDRRRFTTCD